MTLQNFTLGTFSQGIATATASFESIATLTGNGSATALTFSSIPSTYQHLQIRAIAKRAGTTTSFSTGEINFNSDFGTNYASHNLTGDGTSATAGGSSTIARIYIQDFIAGSGTGFTNTVGYAIIDILDYASTSKNKTVRIASGGQNDTGSTGNKVNLSSGLWMSTSAINSITFNSPAAFTTQTTFALYGIKGA